MKKLLTILLTVMITFTTVTVNITGEDVFGNTEGTSENEAIAENQKEEAIEEENTSKKDETIDDDVVNVKQEDVEVTMSESEILLDETKENEKATKEAIEKEKASILMVNENVGEQEELKPDYVLNIGEAYTEVIISETGAGKKPSYSNLTIGDDSVVEVKVNVSQTNIAFSDSSRKYKLEVKTTAKKEGVTTFSFNYSYNGESHTVNRTVKIKKAAPAPTGITLTYNGSNQSLVSPDLVDAGYQFYKATKDYSKEKDITFSIVLPQFDWSNTIQGKNVGTYENIYWKANGSDVYSSVEPNKINRFTSTIIKASTTASIETQTYTGSAITPDVNFELKGSDSFNKSTDYSVNYTNNTDIGTATATVSLKNTEVAKNYQLTNTDGKVIFKIVDTLGSVSFADDTSSFVKTGSPINISNKIIVKSTNGATLSSDHYELTGDVEKTEMGTYTVTVTPKGDYISGNPITATWSITDPYDISAATISVAVNDKNTNYAGVYNGLEQSLTKDNLTVVFGENNNFTDYEIVVDETSSSVKDASDEYIITIQGVGDYHDKASTTWTIAQKEVVKPTAKTNLKYTDSSILGVNNVYEEGTTNLLDGLTFASENDDEKVVSAVNAGNYTAKFKLASTNYKWSDNSNADIVTVNWSIGKKDADKPTAKTNLIYNNQDLDLVNIPTLETENYKFYVSDSQISWSTTLKGKTFTSDGYKAKDAGKYFVYYEKAASDNVNGINRSTDNYIEVNIAAADLAKINVELKQTEYPYETVGVTPVVTSDLGDLKLGTDIQIKDITGGGSSYKDSYVKSALGDYSINIKAKNKSNFTGEVTGLEWSIINDYDISKAIVTYNGANHTYDGSEKEVTVSDFEVKYSNIVLTAGTDYKLETTNTIKANAGEYEVTFTGLNDWAGKTVTGKWKINKATPAVYCNVDGQLTSCSVDYTGEDQVLVKLATSEIKSGYKFYISEELYDSDTLFGLLVSGLAANAWVDDISKVTKKEPDTYYVYWKVEESQNYTEVAANRKNVVAYTIQKVTPANTTFKTTDDSTKNATATYTRKDGKLGLIIKPTSGGYVESLTWTEEGKEPVTIELIYNEDGSFTTADFVAVDETKNNTFVAKVVDMTDALKAKQIDMLVGGFTGSELKEKLRILLANNAFKIRKKTDTNDAVEYIIDTNVGGVNTNTAIINGEGSSIVIGADEVWQYQYSTRSYEQKWNNAWIDFVVNEYYETTKSVVGADANNVSFKQRLAADNTKTEAIDDKIYAKNSTEITVNKLPYLSVEVKFGNTVLNPTSSDETKELYVIPTTDYSKYADMASIAITVTYSLNSKIVVGECKNGAITYDISDGITFKATADSFYKLKSFKLTTRNNENGQTVDFDITDNGNKQYITLESCLSIDLSSKVDLTKNNTYIVSAEFELLTVSDIKNSSSSTYKTYTLSSIYDGTLLSVSGDGEGLVKTGWRSIFGLDNSHGFEIDSIDKKQSYDIDVHTAILNPTTNISMSIFGGTIYRMRTYTYDASDITHKEKKYSDWTYFVVDYYTDLVTIINEYEKLTTNSKYTGAVTVKQIDEKGNEIDIKSNHLLTSYDTIIKITDVPYMTPYVSIKESLLGSDIDSKNVIGTHENGATTFKISKDNYASLNKGDETLVSKITELLGSILSGDKTGNAIVTVTIDFEDNYEFLKLEENSNGVIKAYKNDEGILFEVKPNSGYKVIGLTYEKYVEEGKSGGALKAAVKANDSFEPTPIEIVFNQGEGVADSKNAIAFDENKMYLIKATIVPELEFKNATDRVAKAYKLYDGTHVVPNEEELFDAMVKKDEELVSSGNDTKVNQINISYFCLPKDSYSNNKNNINAWRSITAGKTGLDTLAETFLGLKVHEFGDGYFTNEAGDLVELIRISIDGKTEKSLSSSSWDLELILRDTRTPIAIYRISNYPVTVTYSEDKLEADLIAGIYANIDCFDVTDPNKMVEKSMEELGLDSTDFDYLDLPENASIFKKEVRIFFKGNDDLKPVDDKPLKMDVRVNHAKSNLDISAKTRKYNGLPIDVDIKVEPNTVSKAYIISGIDSHLDGYVSINIDTNKMVYEIPESSEIVEELIRQVLGSGIQIPDNIKTILEAYLDSTEENRLGEVAEWINNLIGKEIIPSTETTRRKLVESLVNLILPEQLKGIYRDNKLYYGDAIVGLMKMAVSEKNTVKLSNYISELNKFFERINVGENEDINNILEIVNKALETIEGANKLHVYVNDSINATPTEAGIYSIFGSTIDRNYIPELTIDTFAIEARFDGSIDWETNPLGTKLIGNTYIVSVRDAKDLDFGAHYNAPSGIELSEEEISKQTQVKYLYFGGEVITEEEINNIESLEDIAELIKKDTYLGNDVNEIDLEEGGTYTELAYVLGNFIEGKARVFTINRVDTDIEIKDINVDYNGTATKNDILAKLNTKENNYIIAEDNKNVLVTDGDKPLIDIDVDEILRPDVYYFGLEGDLKLYQASKEVPGNAGVYLMYARFAGDKFYKGTNILKDEIEDIGELIKMLNDKLKDLISRTKDDDNNISLEDFKAQAKKLGLPILTINKLKVDVKWDLEKVQEELEPELSINKTLLTINYIGFDASDYDVRKFVTTTGILKEDLDANKAILTYLNTPSSKANHSLLENHTLSFAVTGDNAKNYYINDIADVIEANIGVLYYHINPIHITIEWMKKPLVGIDYSGNDVYGTRTGSTLTYEYCGRKVEPKEFIDVNNLLPVDVDNGKVSVHYHYVLDELLGKTDAGLHSIQVSLEGDAKDCYVIDTEVVEKVIGTRVLYYNIKQAPLTIKWDDITEIEDAAGKMKPAKVVGDTLSFEYAGQNIDVKDYVLVSGVYSDDDVNITFTNTTPNAGIHTLTATPTGKQRLNYDIENGTLTKLLTYTISQAPLTIKWDENNLVVGKDYYGKDVEGTIAGNTFTSQYVGDKYNPTKHVIADGVYENDDVRLLFSSTSPNVGTHVLTATPYGSDRLNYDIEGSTLTQVLTYKITPAPITISWKRGVEGTTLYRNVLNYTYNGNVDYLDDKFNVYGIFDCDINRVNVEIANGKKINANKTNRENYVATFKINGKLIGLSLSRYSDNYEIVTRGLFYHIKEKPIVITPYVVPNTATINGDDYKNN